MKRIDFCRSCSGALLLIALVAPLPLLAQEQPQTPAAPSHEEVAKQLANPVADLVSIPFQFNWEEGVGPNEDLRFLINFQPVVPFSIGEKWNLIGRFILPFLAQPPLVEGGQSTVGTSDIVLSAFFSPAAPRVAVWGLGPVFGLPTTTDPFLGSGKWSVGPTAVVLKQTGPLTYGALVNHLWSVADTGNTPRADVNQTYLQPFFAYTTKTAVTYTASSEMTANWEAGDDNTWTVPVLFNVAKITRLGPFPFSVGGGLGIFAAAPEGGPDWKLRMTATLILPRGK